jgi:pimeloyl-ACP methyl ester carboxylesterase
MNETYQPRRAPVHEEVVVRGLRHHVTRWPGIDERGLVVLLHGWMDTGDTFQFLVDAMSDRHTFVAPDLRGFGRTEWPEDGYWFPDYYGDLDALLDLWSPDAPVTIVGHSMGGNIATLYAGIRPERVGRVVCIEGFGLPRTQPEQAPGRFREWLKELRHEHRLATFPSLEAFAHLLARRNPRLTPERARFIAQSWTRPVDGGVQVLGDPRHKRVNAVLYRREEAEACWREVVAPVLYVVAAQSEFLSRLGEDGRPERMSSIIRRLEPCVIEDASHMLHHERPAELARAIEAFLDRTG